MGGDFVYKCCLLVQHFRLKMALSTAIVTKMAIARIVEPESETLVILSVPWLAVPSGFESPPPIVH